MFVSDGESQPVCPDVATRSCGLFQRAVYRSCFLFGVLAATRVSAQTWNPRVWVDGAVGLGTVAGSTYTASPSGAAILRVSARISEFLSAQIGAEAYPTLASATAGCNERGCGKDATDGRGLAVGVAVGRTTADGPPITGLSLGVGAYRLSALPRASEFGGRVSLERILHRTSSMDVVVSAGTVLIKPGAGSGVPIFSVMVGLRKWRW
jgi:hypothetical protein